MLIPFENLSYLSQTRRLRELAEKALGHYSIKNYKLIFINHGENTTFKVETSKKNYLLRIHRANYHTEKAITEELRWIKQLSEKTDIPVQKPILSKNNKIFVKVSMESIGQARICDLMQWQEGQIKMSRAKNTYFKVGELAAKLHLNTMKTHHRNYWSADGLLGKNATLGSIIKLQHDFPNEVNALLPYKKIALAKMKNFEKNNPHRMSFLHADLHFGNLIWEKGIPKPIDFDDCGYGCQLYDFGVILYSSLKTFKRVGKKKAKYYQENLIEGYNSQSTLSSNEIEYLKYYLLARDLAMIGWLQSRKDNPKLYSYLKANIKNAVKRIQSFESNVLIS